MIVYIFNWIVKIYFKTIINFFFLISSLSSSLFILDVKSLSNVGLVKEKLLSHRLPLYPNDRVYPLQKLFNFLRSHLLIVVHSVYLY